MTGWAIVLILSMAGIVVILLRRLPAAIKDAASRPVAVVSEVRSDPAPSPVETLPKKKKSSPAATQLAEPPQSKKPPKLDELDLDHLLELGEAYFRDHDYMSAHDVYVEILRRKEDPKWFNRLGVISLELERYREARDAFRAALRFGVSASRHANLGLAEYALGHRVTAISHLRKAIALAPQVVRYQELLDQIESGE